MAKDTRVSTNPVDTLVSPPAGEFVRGEVVGERWRLDEFLSRGGMGRVWRAMDLRLQEPVAIKLMDPALVETNSARERFFREARAAAKLRGPHVVSVLDFDVDVKRRVPYIAMELLHGEDLARRLERGPLDYTATLAVLEDVCAAMTRAHRQQIIHRDLKPGNVFLVDTPGPLGAGDTGLAPPEPASTAAKVLDFGIVKLGLEPDARARPLTSVGMRLGTISYMSPEQIDNSRQVDRRADLWSIAVIAFECLTGRRPFQAESIVELINEICNGDTVVPSRVAPVPAGFDAWFARGTHRDIEHRFSTASELLEAFAALAGAADQVDASHPSGRSGVLASKLDLVQRQPAQGSPQIESWASDANQIDIRVLSEMTFKNAVVHEFLESGNKHFVTGSKGLGKTLLLTYKRFALSEQYQGRAVRLIPEGRPYLDLMGDLPSMRQAQIDLMSSLAQCKRLWAFAFRVAAVSNHAGLVDEDQDREDLQHFPKRLRAMVEGRPAQPTVVVKELLSLPFGQVNRLIDDTESFLEHKIRSLHSGMFMFVDKLDQALRQLPRRAWVHMQAGMIEAAWDLMNTNRHLKVFATIREEAFSSYESDIKTNLFGAASVLRYSKRDLEDMLEKLTRFYEGLPLRDFVIFDLVRASSVGRREAVFDYIYRHTLGRPRDLVIIASEISRNRRSLDEGTFKQIVRETSASLLVSNVFDEMRVFLEVLHDRDKRNHLLAALPYNVLTHDELVDLWCEFHGMPTDREYYELHGKNAEEAYHPFRELYDCGLLGVIARDPSTERKTQRFRQPHDAVAGSLRQLPRSRYYLLHPALQTLITRLAGGGHFRPFRHVAIGHGLSWPRHLGPMLDVQRAMFKVGERIDEDLEDAIFAILAKLERHLSAGEGFSLARELVASTDAYSRLCANLERSGFDELYLAVLELFPPLETPAEPPPAPARPATPERAMAEAQTQRPGPVRGRPAKRPSRGSATDRVVVAMLLVDMVKSTRMVQDLGDTHFVERLDLLEEALREVSAPRVLKGTGDGFLAVYDSVARAIAASDSLRAGFSDPPLRLNVHLGAVRLAANDALGSEVHRLFRMEAVSEEDRLGARPGPGEPQLPAQNRLVISRAAWTALPPETRERFVALGDFELESFDDPVSLYLELELEAD
ncbi:protein kinase [Plesiocystis pacifica SIR-1]|uniref:Protein kinase n=1 Tax=Plesiocystis pacifica SIR-1 TaxID=391625 RepID=A6G8X7_9BACT|nr:protein kinase [Plesiocystis pacifica]EDM77663.1 protein kinase [Plesiocystis pacifica SIR-1]